MMLLIGFTSFTVAQVQAIDVNEGIYFTEQYKGKPNYYPNGYTSHIFNKYLDSVEICKAFLQLKDNDLYMKKQYLYALGGDARETLKKIDQGDECIGNLYSDERNFLGVNLLYSKVYDYVNDALEMSWNNYGFRQMHYSLEYDTPEYRPQEGDLVQVRVYVHDNAGTDPKDTIANTKVQVTTNGGNITAKVGNDNVSSSDVSRVVLASPSTDELVFATASDYPNYKFKDNTTLLQMANYVTYRESTTDPISLQSKIGPKKVKNLSTSEYRVSNDKKELVVDRGTQIGSFPYSYTLTLDLVVKKKTPTQAFTCTDRINGVAGAGVRLSTDVCLPGQSQVINGVTQTCNTSCQFPVNETCTDRVRTGHPQTGEICEAGKLTPDGKQQCNNQCTGFVPVAETCRDIYYKDQARFKSQGYECITADGKASASCSGDQPAGGVGACKIIGDQNQKCSACGCIELNVEPVAGNYQRITYTVAVSNQTTNTLAANVEVRSKKADGSVGYRKLKYLDNIRNGGTINRDISTNEGEVRLTDDAAQVKAVITKRSPRRDTDPLYKNLPNPSVDADSVVKFLQNPKDNYILVNNLVPGSRAGTIDVPSDGDEVTITIPATVRTDQNGTDKYGNAYSALQNSTQFVDYLFFLKTQTNGAFDNVAISKPYFVTYNAGDVVTSLAVTGLVNAGKLANVFNSATNTSSFNEVSGFLFDSGSTSQIFSSSKDFQGITYSTGFKQDLTTNIAKTTNEGMSTQGSLFANSTVLNSESAISNTTFSQRLDGERIFTLERGDVTITGNNTVSVSGAQQATLSLSNRSTVIIKNGDLIINTNVTYADMTNNVVPAIAFIVQNGNIKIDPRVTRIDGVYVANKFMGTDDWKSIYETQKLSPVRLLVNGALLGSINDLITSRPFVDSPTAAQGGASINVNYDGRMIATPPPGLREILGGTFEKLKQ